MTHAWTRSCDYRGHYPDGGSRAGRLRYRGRRRGAPDGTIVAVGAENEYADVLAQIGGKYVRVTAIDSNPNTDPHEFEANASDAAQVAAARLVVQAARAVGHGG